MTVRDLVQRLGNTRDYTVFIKDHSSQLLGWIDVREWDELRFEDMIMSAQEYLDLPVAYVMPCADHMYVEVDTNVI